MKMKSSGKRLNKGIKQSWKRIIAREYGVQYTEVSIKCLSPLNKSIVPVPFYEQVYIPEDGNEVCYILEDKWNAFVSALQHKYFGNLDNYEDFHRMFMSTGKDYMETARAISRNNLKDKSNDQLKLLYMDYLKKNYAYCPFVWMQFIINNFFAEKAKEIITDKVEEDKQYEYMEIALRPEEKAASIQLNEIASEWETLEDKEKIEIYENFRWIPCLDIHNKSWTKEEFFSHIGDFKKVEKKQQVTYEALLKDLSKKEILIIEIARKLSYLKDLKDDFRRQGIFHAQSLFEEIGRRMGLGLQDMSYLTEEEIIDFLDKDSAISKNLVEQRKQGFAIYFNQQRKIECKSGEEIDTALIELGIIIHEEYHGEIGGTPASSGKAKGTAVIVKGVSDLHKVKHGDILVAVTTHPDFVPAMQRAAAIITDEGGITSHAAIVAREFGLPCVVGTKHATKVLKDGDEIEVDADQGIVRKIEK